LASAEDLTAALRVDVASEIGVQFVYIRIIWFAVWIIFPVENYPFAVGRAASTPAATGAAEVDQQN
jgi:hypothetical protein